jgi:hypothetical protein
MKKLMFAIAVAALLYIPTAKAVYIGTFTAGSSYSVDVVATSAVETAVTFMSVVRGRLQFDNMITSNGNFPPINIAVPAHADRVILLIDTRGGSALTTIDAGNPQEVSADPEARAIADLVP